MNIGAVKRHTREEKRPILLSLRFICFLSVVAVLARISSSSPSSVARIGKSTTSASEDENDDDVNNFNGNARNDDEEAEDEDARFPRNGFPSGARERGNDGTMTLLRKCSRQRLFRRGREDDEEDADEEETQRGGQEQERRVQKSWIFQTNAKRLGYVHMASIHPVATKTRRKDDDDDDGKKVLLAAWQGAHKVEGTDDQSLFVSKSADGGATWTKARVVPGRKFGVRWAPTFFSSSSSGSNSGGGGGETTYLFYAEREKCWHCESGECEDIVRKRKSGSEEEDVSVYWDESKEGIVSKAKKAASVGPWWRPGGNIKRVSIRINDDEDGDINDDP